MALNLKQSVSDDMKLIVEKVEWLRSAGKHKLLSGNEDADKALNDIATAASAHIDGAATPAEDNQPSGEEQNS